MTYEFENGRRSKYFYKNNNIAIIVTWVDTPKEELMYKPSIELIVSKNNITVSDKGQITSMPYTYHPIETHGDTDEFSVGDNTVLWLLGSDVISKIKDAIGFYRTKENEYFNNKRLLLSSKKEDSNV